MSYAYIRDFKKKNQEPQCKNHEKSLKQQADTLGNTDKVIL